MKYCTHCGAEILDEAVICPKCGCTAGNSATHTAGESNRILGMVAKILMLITTISTAVTALSALLLFVVTAVTSGVLLGGTSSGEAIVVWGISVGIFLLYCLGYALVTGASLAWQIPMTLSVWRKLKNNEKIGVGFKICVLIFVNLVSGILLLCINDNGIQDDSTTSQAAH